MKKIVFIYISSNRIIKDILNNLKLKKYDLLYFTLKLNPFNNKISNKKVLLEFPFNNIKFAYFPKKILYNLNKIKPDKIILTDVMNFYFFQSFYYKLKNSKVELILYSEVKRLPKNIFFKFLGFLLLNFLFKYFISKKVSKILCFTTDSIIFYQNLLSKRKKDILLFPAVIDTKIFKPKKDNFFLKENILNLLIIARMVECKNYFGLLKSLKYLKEKKDFSNFKLNILGDGPLKNKIVKKITKYNLEKNVTFLKKVSNDKIKHYYYENDILILPSFNEAIGMVVPESMSCGTPCIISDTVGAKTYIKNNENGLIFKTGDYKDLAKQILELNNKKNLKKFGKNASETIKKNYSLENVNGYFKKVL